MKTRIPNEEQPQAPMVSACDVLKAMLRTPPKKKVQSVGGGVGVTGKGQPVWNPSGSIDSTDEDTNRLVRAALACKEEMVVSPHSTKQYLLYTPKEKYQDEVNEVNRAREIEADRKSSGWFSSK